MKRRKILSTLSGAVLAVAALTTAGLATSNAPADAASLCASSPHVCGFPDGTNTGWTGELSALKVENYAITLGTKGEVLKNVTTNSPITVTAPDVTIDNVRIVGSFPDQPGISLMPAANDTTIEHTTIRGNANSGTGAILEGVKDIEGTPVTGTLINQVNVYNVSGGFQLYAGTIENSYVHGLVNANGWHLEDYNSTGNDGYRVNLWKDTLLNAVSQTAAVYEGADFSPSANIHVWRCLLAGGGYTVYGGAGNVGPHSDPSNITFRDNVFSRIYYPDAGFYGPVAYYQSGNGDAWTGNTWDNGTSAGSGTVGS